jgi:hypothetical protein
MPRPKFHVILLLSKPLVDEHKYKAFCQWFIHNFNGDPQVTDTARLLFGYGEHQNPIVEHWNQGRCVDEVLSDDDLIVIKPKQKVAIEHSLLPASETVIELCRQEVAQCDPSIEGKGGDTIFGQHYNYTITRQSKYWQELIQVYCFSPSIASIERKKLKQWKTSLHSNKSLRSAPYF